MKRVVFAIVFLFSIMSCKQEKLKIPNTLNLKLDNLKSGGDSFLYEIWKVVGNDTSSIGTIKSIRSKTVSYSIENVSEIKSVFITMEPENDLNDKPSDYVILSGDFTTPEIELKSHFPDHLMSAKGHFTFTSLTGNDSEKEKYSGVWFIKEENGVSVAGLKLPVLDEHWKYNANVYLSDAHRFSIGALSNGNSKDNLMKYYSNDNHLSFPGEDFFK